MVGIRPGSNRWYDALSVLSVNYLDPLATLTSLLWENQDAVAQRAARLPIRVLGPTVSR